jgi:hypothetical protein
MLFLGGGTLSAVVDIRVSRAVHQRRVARFWSFEHAPCSILELGEIECFLYRTDGELVGSAMVDPPYEVVRGADDLSFVTTLFGTPRIPYPPE